MNLAINTNYAMTYGMIYFKNNLGATFGPSSLCSVKWKIVNVIIIIHTT
jgi:hypothetical protein